jgi:peroxiredoxin
MSFKESTLKDLLAEKEYAIVYFYPLDFTPNCTIQAIDFSTMLEDFDAK